MGHPVEVLADCWELTPNQRSSVVDSPSNHIIRRGRHHPAIREWEPLDQKRKFIPQYSTYVSAVESRDLRDE